MNKHFLIFHSYINFIPYRAEQQKFSVKVLKDAFPETVICEAVSKQCKTLRLSRDQQLQFIDEYEKNYVLKVCGTQEFLLKRHPICQYKVIDIRKLLANISFTFDLQIFAVHSSVPIKR